VFVAARLVQNLEPAGLVCGREIPSEVCAALSANPQDAQEFSALSELFERLEQARAPSGQATSSRLAVAGLSAAEVGTRLEEIEKLRQALGALD
jgi:hypothetical protein